MNDKVAIWIVKLNNRIFEKLNQNYNNFLSFYDQYFKNYEENLQHVKLKNKYIFGKCNQWIFSYLLPLANKKYTCDASDDEACGKVMLNAHISYIPKSSIKKKLNNH